LLGLLLAVGVVVLVALVVAPPSFLLVLLLGFVVLWCCRWAGLSASQ
jgi:hypothetical protein